MKELERRLACRTMVAATGLLLGAWACARACVWTLERIAPVAYAKATDDLGRLHAILGAVEGIASGPSPAVVALGSSSMLFDFSPQAFDEEALRLGGRAVSYNLAVPVFDPAGLDLLAERVAGAFRRRSARLGLSIIEFPVNESTARFQSRMALPWLKRSRLTAWPRLARLALSHPARAGRMAALKALDDFGPAQGAELAWLALLPARDGGFQDGLAAAFGGRFPRWDASRRGEWRLLFPETRRQYDALMSAYSTRGAVAALAAQLDETSDYTDVRLDEEQIEDFISAVRSLQSASDRVIVLLAPRHPWTPESPQGERRVQEALSRIRGETGALVLDMRRGYGPDSFRDVLHLNETSRTEFSRRLAQAAAR